MFHSERYGGRIGLEAQLKDCRPFRLLLLNSEVKQDAMTIEIELRLRDRKTESERGRFNTCYL